jgi:hypothetical protein
MLAKHASPITSLISIAESLGLSAEDASDYVNTYYTDNVYIVLRQCIDHFFRPNPRGEFYEGRFNKPTFPCLYSSDDERTAAIEKLHYLCKDPDIGPAIELAIFSLRVDGTFWNTEAVTDPDVIALLRADVWGYCQQVGELARNDSDGVKASSARCAGINMATYRRTALISEHIVRISHVDKSKAASLSPLDVLATSS